MSFEAGFTEVLGTILAVTIGWLLSFVQIVTWLTVEDCSMFWAK
jgi:hypothetical protein